MSELHGKTAPVEIVRREEAPTQMSPVVRAIMEKNLSPETVREMLAMQREHEANEARKQYVAAYIGLKAELPKTLARDKRVSFGTTNYTHTSLAAAVEEIVPHLITHGFAHDWRLGMKDGQVMVTCRLTHVGGHHEEVTLPAPPDTKGAKNGAQAIASTATMLERYTLLGLLGIATADMKEPDDDHEEKPDPAKVDTAKNMRLVEWLGQHGKSREQAEEFVARKMPEWTASDIAAIVEWARPAGKPEAKSSTTTHANDCASSQGDYECDCRG